MLRRRQFGFAAAGCVAALAAPAVRAQATTMRLALIAQVGQPIELGAQRFKQLVEQQTGGKLRVDIFPGGQLGGEIQLQDSVSNGTFQMACIGTPLAAGKLKKLDILNMYYLWKDREHMKRVLTGPIGKDLFDEYGAKTGIEVLAANWQQGTRHTMSKRRFTKPRKHAASRFAWPPACPFTTSSGVQWVRARCHCRSPRPTAGCRQVWSTRWNCRWTSSSTTASIDWASTWC